MTYRKPKVKFKPRMTLNGHEDIPWHKSRGIRYGNNRRAYAALKVKMRRKDRKKSNTPTS